jgi:hypothetical protein
MTNHIPDVSRRGDVKLPYWTALGRFVSLYSQIEFQLFLTLCHYTKTSIPIGRAVFSGAKTIEIIGHINRILEVTNREKTKHGIHLRYLFAQIAFVQLPTFQYRVHLELDSSNY